MTRIIFLLLTVFFSHMTVAQSDGFKKRFEENKNRYSQQFEERYKAYRDAFRKRLASYRGEVEEVWGYAQLSTPSSLVVYSNDLQLKLVADFEAQTLEVAYQKVEGNHEAQISSFVAKTLLTPLSELYIGVEEKTKIDNRTLAIALGLDEKRVEQIASTILEKGLAIDADTPLKQTIADLQKAESKLETFRESLPEQRQSEERQYQRSLTRVRQSYQAQLARRQADPRAKNTQVKRMPVSRGRWERALTYADLVKSYSKDSGIPQYLIYAVMETESSFNPKAMSPIPAFGLMQIVPESAGADVSRKLKLEKPLPTPDELFQAQTNILFGSTYLKMLYVDYFSGITDARSRTLCVIAAYNTGMGNVARTFNLNGEKTLGPAIDIINGMASDSVEATLLDGLPFDETKKYLQKVTSAADYYQQQLVN